MVDQYFWYYRKEKALDKLTPHNFHVVTTEGYLGLMQNQNKLTRLSRRNGKRNRILCMASLKPLTP